MDYSLGGPRAVKELTQYAFKPINKPSFTKPDINKPSLTKLDLNKLSTTKFSVPEVLYPSVPSGWCIVLPLAGLVGVEPLR